MPVLLGGPTIAQQKTVDHATHHPVTAAGSVDGEVRQIDKCTGKLTLKQGEIKNLDMRAMTMVFQV